MVLIRKEGTKSFAEVLAAATGRVDLAKLGIDSFRSANGGTVFKIKGENRAAKAAELADVADVSREKGRLPRRGFLRVRDVARLRSRVVKGRRMSYLRRFGASFDRRGRTTATGVCVRSRGRRVRPPPERICSSILNAITRSNNLPSRARRQIGRYALVAIGVVGSLPGLSSSTR